MAGFAEELRRIPMSQGLGATLARAADYAQAQQHGEVALEHLLLSLTEDDDAAQVLAASHVDMALLKADVSNYLGSLDHRPGGDGAGKISLAGDLKRILEAAAAAASQGRRREINGAIVLAAIVGDGRSSAAHMLRSQGLTFEEAIKALQRALASSPQAAPVQTAPPAQGKPEAEDILATARARVQNRAAPGLPPMAPRAEPPAAAPAVELAAEPAAPVALAASPKIKTFLPEPKPPADPTPAEPVHTEPWPPEVRTYATAERQFDNDTDYDSVEADLDAVRYQEAQFEPAHEPSHDDDGYAGGEPGPAMDYGPPDAYVRAPAFPALPPPPPPLPETQFGSQGATSNRAAPAQGGSRWPAPVAPAWRDQQAFDSGRGMPAPPPLPHGRVDWQQQPHNLETGGFQDQYAQPAYEQDQPHGHAPQGYGNEGYSEQGFSEIAYDVREHPPAPPPLPWPSDQTQEALAYAPGDEHQARQLSHPDEDYAAEWPHQEPAQHWPELAPKDGQVAPMGPIAVAAAEYDAAMGVPAGLAGAEKPRRRKAADRAATGHMGETIPRKMRVLTPSQVEVRLAKSELRSLLEGLSEDGDRGAATACLSVRLKALDGHVIVEPETPETLWLETGSSALESSLQGPGPAGGDRVSWRWSVTPLKAGNSRLQLAVSARTVAADGGAVVTAMPEQVITVRAGRSYGRIFARLLGWTLLAVAGGLIDEYGLPLLGPWFAEVMKALK